MVKKYTLTWYMHIKLAAANQMNKENTKSDQKMLSRLHIKNAMVCEMKMRCTQIFFTTETKLPWQDTYKNCHGML